MSAAHQQVDAGDGQNNAEQKNGCGRRIGRIAAAVSVKHVVDVANNGVHSGGI